MRSLALVVLFFGCVPVNPVPPVEPPPREDYTCEAQCARELELKCPEWSESCPADCKRADDELAKRGSPPPDHGCVAHMPTCEDGLRCH